MAYNFSTIKKKGEEVIEWLKKEFSGIRTGRASVSILDNISVDSYGAKMPINQLATITTEDARTLLVNPWDTEQIKPIEKAIRESDLGISVSVGETGLRVSFPELTSERRESLIKIINQKEEEAKISLRQVREDVWDDIQKSEKEKEITEDDKFRLKDDMQKIVDDFTKKIEEISEAKKEDLRTQ